MKVKRKLLAATFIVRANGEDDAVDMVTKMKAYRHGKHVVVQDVADLGNHEYEVEVYLD